MNKRTRVSNDLEEEVFSQLLKVSQVNTRINFDRELLSSPHTPIFPPITDANGWKRIKWPCFSVEKKTFPQTDQYRTKFQEKTDVITETTRKEEVKSSTKIFGLSLSKKDRKTTSSPEKAQGNPIHETTVLTQQSEVLKNSNPRQINGSENSPASSKQNSQSKSLPFKLFELVQKLTEPGIELEDIGFEFYDALNICQAKSADKNKKRHYKQMKNNINYKLKKLPNEYPQLAFYGDSACFTLARLVVYPDVLIKPNDAKLREQFQSFVPKTTTRSYRDQQEIDRHSSDVSKPKKKKIMK